VVDRGKKEKARWLRSGKKQPTGYNYRVGHPDNAISALPEQ
jgi:hypothetical protein